MWEIVLNIIFNMIVVGAAPILISYKDSHKPIGININEIGKDIVRLLIIIESVILLIMICYFKWIGDKFLKLCIVAYILILIAGLGLILFKMVKSLCKQRAIVLIGLIYILLYVALYLSFCYINTLWVLKMLCGDIKTPILFTIAMAIPILMVITGTLLIMKEPSLYKGTMVEIYYTNKDEPEKLKYEDLYLKKYVIAIREERFYREINRDFVYEIKYEKMEKKQKFK